MRPTFPSWLFVALVALGSATASAQRLRGEFDTPPAKEEPAASAPAPAASASGPTVRTELAAPLQAAQQALAAKQYQAALDQLGLAGAVQGQTPYETYVVARLRYAAALGLGDKAGALAAAEAVLATDQGEPELRLALMGNAALLAAELKDDDRTIAWSREFAQAGGAPSTPRSMQLAYALYQKKQYAEAAKVLDELAARQQAAGETATAGQLRMHVASLQQVGDDAAAMKVLERILAVEPKPEIWLQVLSMVRRQPGFTESVQQDLLRLGVRTDAWTSAVNYVALADQARRAGFPQEAAQVLEQARARGHQLGQGNQAEPYEALRKAVASDVAADTATSRPDAKALASRPAQIAFNAGWHRFTAGQADEGLALMTQAVERGIDKDPDLARLRLGEAAVSAGKSELARRWLQPLQQQGGIVGDLARLWLLSLK